MSAASRGERRRSSRSDLVLPAFKVHIGPSLCWLVPFLPAGAFMSSLPLIPNVGRLRRRVQGGRVSHGTTPVGFLLHSTVT